ncbi:MAG: hypothetical protein ACT4QE_16555, partial [Anaerolineales bacterium]
MPNSRLTTLNLLSRVVLVVAQISFAVGLPLGVSLTTIQAAGTITGTVFQDFNANGARDTSATIPNNGGSDSVPVAVDRGLAGVVVTAYDAAGLAVGSTTSIADGTYSLSASGTGPYRIEFTNLPAGFQPGPRGANNGTTVRFVPDGNSTAIDLGVNRPGDYCQDNPQLVTSCYVFGDQLTGTNALSRTVVSFPYSSGSNSATEAEYDQPLTHTVEISASQVGVTWGLAYARATQRVYAAAYMKKHSGFGPGGPGGVYVINPANNTVISTFTVPNAISNTHDTADYQIDNGNLSWNAVGKTALGGLDLSDDETRLFVMNLEDRALYALNPTTGAVIVSSTVPLNPPLPVGTCPAGDVRPFGVEFYEGQVYVGLVCSAESDQNAANLQAYVYTATTSLNFSAAPAFQMPLTYTRGLANDGPTGQPAEWNPWVTGFTALPPNFTDPNANYPVYPQPMLTSITFDVNGDMVLGLRDRFGDQMGNAAPSNPANPSDLYFGVTGGDTLRACAAGGGWTLESNGRCDGDGTAPQGT